MTKPDFRFSFLKEGRLAALELDLKGLRREFMKKPAPYFHITGQSLSVAAINRID